MARAPKVTWERIDQMIANGIGSGFGEAYQPIIQIKRWNPSPVSTQIIKPLAPFKRACHFLSQSEYWLGLLFSWVGCEIREQFPLWPWSHPHPELGRNLSTDRFLKESSGLIEICKQAGIKHGNFPGTNIPYIWSMDFCLYLPWVKDFKRSCTMVSVKPMSHKAYKNPDPISRVLEKLEGERRYCAELGIHYLIGDHQTFQRRLFGNLESIQSSALLNQHNPSIITLNRFLDKHGHKINKQPLSFVREVLVKDYKCSDEIAILIRNYLIWHQIIDLDLSAAINEAQLPRPGGRTFKELIKSNLEGK
ncbi:MAG TPA: hypothetical protein VES38_03840 [Methylotenera sp.]|nr:hypothetical protein [Methylotenera sp.]